MVEWVDGTRSWIPLHELKEANPVELAEYSVSRNIHEEPAFAWWVPHVLKKREHFIKQVHIRVAKKAMKFGVIIPSSVDEALSLDKQNGNNFWQKAIEKELKNVIVAFKLLDEGDKPLPGSKEIPYHIIFDVKFDLTRKARLVAGGHRNKDVPAHTTYSTVASRESVRIGFLVAALNGLDILAGDIGNAYLNAPNREKIHVKCGPELFGPSNAGRYAVVVRALYGLKSAAAAWRHHLAQSIRTELGYEESRADPDVHMKPKVKPSGEQYYSYLIIYVDDILCIDIDPKKTMDKLSAIYRMKEGSVETPTMYLGANVKQWTVQNVDGEDTNCWAMGSNTYVKEAVKVAKQQATTHGLTFPTGKKLAASPFTSTSYRPELDPSNFCNSDLLSLYQNLIGVLRWICELGRIDILHEVSLLSQYLASPRIGHIKQALNIFHYLDYHDRSWMVFNPTKFDVQWSPKKGEPSPQERAKAMRDIYYDAEDILPHNMPQPLGNSVNINVFLDADHAGNKVTRRSHTGIILYLNMAPITWLSKRQNTVESSTFGSEFIAMRLTVEMVESMQYKLRMFGIPIDGPARLFCDNESVVTSSSFPESTLKKKHCSIAYHRVREFVAAGKGLIFHENTTSNIADLLTKVLPVERRKVLLQAILD